MGGKKGGLKNRDRSSTCSQVQVPSQEEVAALNEMRSIKNRVRDLKKRLSEISNSEETGDNRKVNELEKEMKLLKEEWNIWDKRREEAARERMILLGHIEVHPDNEYDSS